MVAVGTHPTSQAVAWTAGVSGNWDTGADWSTGAVPGASNAVSISVSGAYTVIINTADAALSLTIDDAGASVADRAGGTLTIGTFLDLTAGTLALSQGGAVTGGTMSVAAGATLLSAGNDTIDSALMNLGLLKVSSGVLTLGEGGMLGGPIAGHGTLTLAGGAFVSQGAAIGGSLHLAIDGTGTLNIAGGDNLLVAGSLAVGVAGDGSGAITGPGTLTTAGETTLSGNAANTQIFLGDGVTWVNDGTVQDNGVRYMNDFKGDAVTIINEAGATFDMTHDSSLLAREADTIDFFTNDGTLTKTGASFTSTIAMSMDNNGLIDVATGTLEIGTLTGGGSLVIGSGATLMLDDGATSTAAISGAGGTLAIVGGVFEASLAQMNGVGVITVSGSGAELESGSDNGTVNTDIDVANQGELLIAGGADLTLTGTLNFNGGYLDGPQNAYGTLTTDGQVTVMANSSIGIGDTAIWINNGTATIGANIEGGTIINGAGAVFDILGSNTSITGASLVNAGTLTIQDGASLANQVDNTGVIDIQSGELTIGTLTGGGSLILHGDTLNINGGGDTSIAISGTSGTLDITGGLLTATIASWTGLANLDIEGSATLAIQDSSAVLTADVFISEASTLSLASGTELTLSGSLTFGNANGGFVDGAGTLTTAGATTIDGSPNLVKIRLGDGITWVNEGTVLDGGIGTAGGATVINAAGANFDFIGDLGSFQGGSGADFMNAGNLEKVAGTGISAVGMAVSNTGEVEAAAGTLQLQSLVSNAGILLATNGATLDLSLGTLTNLSGGNLTGGVYEADAGSVIELANNDAITTDSATIVLDGAGSEIQALDTGTGTQRTLDRSLANIAMGGSLALLDGRDFTATANGGAFSDGGVLNLGGVTFTATTLTIAAGGLLEGSGNVSGAVIDAGSVAVSGGMLSFFGTLTNSGTMDVTGGTLSLVGNTTNNGTIDVASGVASSMFGITGAGTLEVGATGTLTLENGALGGQIVDFLAGAGTVDLDHPLSFFGAIVGFGGADQIDLTKPTGFAETGYNYSDGVLTIVDGSSTVASLHFEGSYSTGSFALSSDGHSGVLLTFV
jgi:hypothetical protein